jgi:hypothetical protein
MGFGAEVVLDHLAQGAGIVGRVGDDMTDPFKVFDQGRGLWAIAALTRRRDQPDGKRAKRARMSAKSSLSMALEMYQKLSPVAGETKAMT